MTADGFHFSFKHKVENATFHKGNKFAKMLMLKKPFPVIYKQYTQAQ